MLEDVSDQRGKFIGWKFIKGPLIDNDFIRKHVAVCRAAFGKRHAGILAQDQMMVLIKNDPLRINFDGDIFQEVPEFFGDFF